MICLILLLGTLAYALDPLPELYHTYDEVYAELQQIQSQYPTKARIYTIGQSQVDHIPIYALKVSNNVNNDDFEPAVVFIGQVHAEEVLGVETTLSNIWEILQNGATTPYGNWLAQLEMWFIPTLNPEGHNMVTTNQDVSWRKNKRDANNNGVLDIDPRVGYDPDGVDINRNFDINWCHGDTLLQPGIQEVYDYYRGPAPMSESETQAFANFCEQQRPVMCIVWHSSRTGNLSEKVFYPLNWALTRPAPDLLLGQQIGEGVAAQIQKVGGGNYEPSAGQGRKGGLNDWMYAKFGTICLVIECGTLELQTPDSTEVAYIIQQNTDGVKWMLNRALPISSAVPSNSMLRGIITDAVTGLPLEAEIMIPEKHAPWFYPRRSNPADGTYWRPVSNGSYTLRYRKKGYAEHVINNANINNSWTRYDVALQPLPEVTIHGSVRSSNGGNLIPAKIVLYDLENDTLFTDGDFTLTSYQGQHRIEVSSDGYYPYLATLNFEPGTQAVQLNLTLTEAAVPFSENWDSGLANWVKNSAWVAQPDLVVSGRALTDSWGGRGWYNQNCNVWIRSQNPIAIPSSGNPLLTFDEHLYTEAFYDSVRVEVSADTLSWHAIYINSGKYDQWHPVYIALSQYTGQSLYLRFRLTDQSNEVDLTDPGWTIDNLRIITGSATPNAEESNLPLPFTRLHPNYPNPFNPETTIKFTLGTDSPVALEIYNLKGQKIRTLTDQNYKSGTHSLIWDGKDDSNLSVASGIYFCRLSNGTNVKSRKLMLMK